MRNPLQPLIVDKHGTVRFKENAIVRYILDNSRAMGNGDMNAIAEMDFSQDDREQFAQLIGYSLCGFHELSYVSDETSLAATMKAKKINPEYGGCRDTGCEIHCGVERK